MSNYFVVLIVQVPSIYHTFFLKSNFYLISHLGFRSTYSHLLIAMNGNINEAVSEICNVFYCKDISVSFVIHFYILQIKESCHKRKFDFSCMATIVVGIMSDHVVKGTIIKGFIN